MTLKARNNFTLAFASVFLALSLAALTWYLYKLNLTLKGESIFNYGISFKGLSFFSNNIWTLCFESLCMAAYIPIAAFYAYARFEKTPSNEVAYFALFLLGCVPELFRLSIPLESVQNTYPQFLVIVGRALFWGRSLSFVSLFAASITDLSGKKLNAEQNIFIILLFSLALANAAPINTSKVSQAFNIQIGWQNLHFVLFVLLAALTAGSYIVAARTSENSLCLKLGVDVLCLEAGLSLLNSSGIMAMALPGALLLFVGTFRYFFNLHKLYS